VETSGTLSILREAANEKRILVFSSDNPHSDSDFPKATQEFFHQEMPADSPRRILWRSPDRELNQPCHLSAP
jgi:hypothetical protein